MSRTGEEMQTSVWSVLYSWSVCKETRFKRGCVFQPKSVVCSVLTQLHKLKLKDSTGVFFFFLMFVPGCPSSLTTSWCRLHTVSTEMSGFVVFLSVEGFGPHSFCHTPGSCPARRLIIVNTAQYLVLPNFLYLITISLCLSRSLEFYSHVNIMVHSNSQSHHMMTTFCEDVSTSVWHIHIFLF